jgi:hypothetical protein
LFDNPLLPLTRWSFTGMILMPVGKTRRISKSKIKKDKGYAPEKIFVDDDYIKFIDILDRSVCAHEYKPGF